ncbi:SWIM zinc finger domain-containing protein [Methanospirillum stamsii]|uniref:SWIM-type domain-containing protein n=1 Tax=Methanospirillum stamsii TaxID=1277351 RepID=A0A2V2NJ06_9EURY|nr:SWIM zinc finger family protein [Methanospirillum stamsii]PWR76338.1 hypothetical protein DLD82_00580 [Methanospirillum stamsii]
MKHFRDLTYEDLNTWFGQKTVSRGKSYQKGGQVVNVYQIADDVLCGEVQGSELYHTVVSLSGNRTSTCSCPVEIDCKHGVALILEYLNQIKQGTTISKPPSNEYAKKYKPLLSSESESHDLPILSFQHEKPVTKDYLKTLSKDKLIDIILSSIEGSRNIEVYLDRRQKMEKSSPESSIDAIIAEIDEVTSEELDYSDWYDMDEDDAPDYSGILESFNVLLEEKRYADLIRLGLILLQKANHQVEMDDENGTISSRIYDCIAVVAEAIESSDLPQYQKLLYAIEFLQADEYSLADDIRDFFNRSHPESEWSKVADKLLKEQNSKKIKEGYPPSYRKKSQADWIEMALEKSGRTNEAIGFSRILAEKEGRILEFIELLDHTNHKREAIEWIKKTVNQKPQDPHRVVLFLHKMKKIFEESGDWLMMTALDTEDFFRDPRIGGYKQMIASAKKADIADSLMPYIQDYLKEGTIPSSAKNGSIIPGVLPETGVVLGNRYARVNPPVKPILLEIALDSNDPDGVLEWYDPNESRIRYGSITSPDDRIADVLAEKYPENAIDIWKKQATQIINMKVPDHYHFAVQYLMKIRDISVKTGKTAEFSEYLQNIKTEHARKKRFIQELSVLEGRTILEDI